MEQIFKIAGGVLFSIGSASGILYAITKWYGNIIADKLSQKYAHQLSEELEKYKTILNRKLYVNQKHFDLELSIYKDLMGGVIEMTESSFWLFPSVIDMLPADKESEIKILKSRCEKAIDRFNITSEVVFKNAPFIDKQIYNAILELRDRCYQQIINFQHYRIAEHNYGHLGKDHNEVWETSTEIVERRNKLIEDIRTYLSKKELPEE